MKTKEEFLDALSGEIEKICKEYESDVEENQDKIELFSEYKELLETFQKKILGSNYDVTECKSSLVALGSVCQIRLQKIADILEHNDPEITDDMSTEEMKAVVSSQFSNLKTGLTATIVNGNIHRIIINIIRPSDSELDELKEKLEKLGDSAFEEIAIEMNEDSDEYYFDIGCSRHDAEFLENLMGEFTEFDEFLRK